MGFNSGFKGLIWYVGQNTAEIDTTSTFRTTVGHLILKFYNKDFLYFFLHNHFWTTSAEYRLQLTQLWQITSNKTSFSASLSSDIN